MSDKQTKAEIILLPEGRLINEALFEMDVYKDESGKEGTPFYKVELAFDPAQVTGDGTIEDKIADAFAAKWGEAAADAFLNGERGYVTPLIDGNFLAQKRKEKGKDGGAYEGKLVIRANTQFNKNGQIGPGGVAVYDMDVSEIGAANRQAIYPGCFGQAAVTISCYLTNRGEKAAKFYLSAFQKTNEGDKLVAAKDHSSLFKPVGKPAGAASTDTGRRRRG